MNLVLSNPGFNIGNLHIAWYGLIMACSMALAVVLCYFFSKKRAINSSDLIVCALYVLPLAVISARLFYVLFNPMGISYTFSDAIKIWEGGMSIWGGVIGGFLGVCLYCWIHKKNIFQVCDVIAPALILAQSTGRWGNFINQEAHGWEVFDPNYFGLPFTVEINGHYYLATFLYEAVLNSIGFIVLTILLFKSKKKGIVTTSYLMWYGVVRSIIETFRTDPMLIGSVKFSQLISILSACIGFILFIYIFIRDKNLAKKGINPYAYLDKINNQNVKQTKQDKKHQFNKNNSKVNLFSKFKQKYLNKTNNNKNIDCKNKDDKNKN